MQRPNLLRAGTSLAAAVALATLSAACAADGQGSAGSAGSGVSDGTIKVGGLITKTSASGYSTAGAEVGAKARFERANAEGGVHGNKIEFIGAEDDGMNPATGDAAVKKLVQREKVFAVVPWVAPATRSAEFLERDGVARYGWASNPTWCGSKVSFGFSGCLAPDAKGPAESWWGRQVAAELGDSDGKTVWIQGYDSSESEYGVSSLVKTFAGAGFKVVGKSSAVPMAPPPQSWLPYVNKVMKADAGGPPDVVVSVMAGKVNLGFYGALKKAGYKGMLTDATSYDPQLIGDPQGAQVLEGVFAAPQFAPFESTSPEIAKMKADVRKVDPGHKFTQHTAAGYWSADVFLKALEKAGKDLTREAFLKAADSLAYENPGFGKVQFPRDKKEPSGCGALVEIKGGKYVVAQPLKCFPNIPAE